MLHIPAKANPPIFERLAFVRSEIQQTDGTKLSIQSRFYGFRVGTETVPDIYKPEPQISLFRKATCCSLSRSACSFGKEPEETQGGSAGLVTVDKKVYHADGAEMPFCVRSAQNCAHSTNCGAVRNYNPSICRLVLNTTGQVVLSPSPQRQGRNSGGHPKTG